MDRGMDRNEPPRQPLSTRETEIARAYAGGET